MFESSANIRIRTPQLLASLVDLFPIENCKQCSNGFVRSKVRYYGEYIQLRSKNSVTDMTMTNSWPMQNWYPLALEWLLPITIAMNDLTRYLDKICALVIWNILLYEIYVSIERPIGFVHLSYQIYAYIIECRIEPSVRWYCKFALHTSSVPEAASTDTYSELAATNYRFTPAKQTTQILLAKQLAWLLVVYIS